MQRWKSLHRIEDGLDLIYCWLSMHLPLINETSFTLTEKNIDNWKKSSTASSNSPREALASFNENALKGSNRLIEGCSRRNRLLMAPERRWETHRTHENIVNGVHSSRKFLFFGPRLDFRSISFTSTFLSNRDENIFRAQRQLRVSCATSNESNEDRLKMQFDDFKSFWWGTCFVDAHSPNVEKQTKNKGKHWWFIQSNWQNEC